MAHDPWINYGTGISIDKIETTPGAILDLIDLVPDFKKDFEEKAGTVENLRKDGNLTVDDINDIIGEFDATESYGLILAIAINAREKVRFVCTNDRNGNTYLIFPDRAAWSYNSKERNMSQQDMMRLLSKYLRYLTDQSLDDLDYGRQEIMHEG